MKFLLDIVLMSLLTQENAFICELKVNNTKQQTIFAL